MTVRELEEAVFDYGAMNYAIGRIETDGTTAQAKYNKLVDKRDALRETLLNHFKKTNA